RYHLDPHTFPTRRSSDLAVGHMHQKGIIHGDLNPENILITQQGFVRLIDFGVATEKEGPRHDFRVAGRQYFRAPELLKTGTLTLDRKSTRLNSSHVKISY